MANQSSGTGQRYPSPIIAARNLAQLIEQVKLLAQYYATDWKFRPDDPDPGPAFSPMFAHLLGGNIRRLNQVPYKSFLAFLNHFNVELAPAQPAAAHITFRLAEGTSEPVFVEKGTQLAASILGESEPIVFETVRPILLTSARLTD